MDIRQLKAFIAVFEEGNITQAAKRLHLSQPALSATIQQLEQQLEVQLFQRQARGTALTDAARVLYPAARRLVNEMGELHQLLHQPQDCTPLILGLAADLGPADVAHFLRQAYQAVNGLLLETVSTCAGDIRLDEESQRCEDELFLPLWEEAYVLALPAHSALANQQAIKPLQLCGQDLVACPEHPSHQRFASILGPAAKELVLAARAANLQQALVLVAAGIGIALLPQGLCQGVAGVITRPLANMRLNRRIGLCYLPENQNKPAVSLLRQYFMSQAG
ncbi:LysR family transcriptional regulator [Neisseriaceae bacterium TC5R-5]|nr:LysR family transcriptional regulator [Neisseriaceae bacterium TC5R-5]